MGGTGAAYLALRHPDMFAAIAPLAPAYSFPWLVANLKHVPSWWIQGAKDAGFYLQGVDIGMERMRQLGAPAKRDLIPNEEHPAGVQRIDAVVGWLLQHKRVSHPREYVFEIDTPLHGRAYWTQADQLNVPGKMAVVRARAADRNRAELEMQNVASVAFFPDPEVFDLASPLEVVVNRQKIFTGAVSAQQQLRLVDAGFTWKTSLEPRSVPALTAYRTHPVAMAPQALENSGTESLLANWITDAMRHATGADIALYNRAADRGLGIPAGTVDIVDLIQCSRPFDQYLVTAELTGKDLLEILDANVPQLAGKDLSAVLGPDPADRNSSPAIPPDRQKANRLVQVSGMKYSFDMALPAGRRIVSSSLQPERRYTVVMEGQVVQRQTMLLAGRFGKLEYKTTGIAFTLALYGHACTTGKIEARTEGRVRERTGS